MQVSEEMKQRNLSKDRPSVNINGLYFYNLGATTLNTLNKTGVIDVNVGIYGDKKPDQIVVDPITRKILAYVEYKKDGKLESEKDKLAAFNEQIFVVKHLGIPLYILTNGTNTFWLNPFQSIPGNNEKDNKNGQMVQIIDETGNNIARSFEPELIKDMVNKNNEFKKLYSLIKNIERDISTSNNQLKPTVKLDPTSLSKSVWQSIYAATGAGPEECLYTFVEIFIFKYLSDLGIINGNYSFSYLLDMYNHKDIKPINVLQYYLNTDREHMRNLFPCGNDKTTIINGSVFHVGTDKNGNLITNHGDENTFKDIIMAFDKYEADYGKFVDIDKDFKTKLFESFLKNDNDVRKKSGQFFTPLKVIQPITEMVDVKLNDKICDPCCGVGKFLLEAIADKIDSFFEFETSEDSEDGVVFKSKVQLYGFEKEDISGKDNRVIVLAKANYLIYFAKMLASNPDINHCKAMAKAFNKTFSLKRGAGGTLEHLEEKKYDLILTNPPYLVNGSGKLKENMSNSSSYTWGGLGTEALFMEWIVKSLKENGFAFVIIPDGLLSNMNNKTLKSKIKELCYIRGLISLPLNSFFATSKKTYIIILQKKESADSHQSKKVFTYICSSIGETLDVNRFDCDENDLKTATKAYKIFKAGDYSDSLMGRELLDDKRMKLLEIDTFDPSESWIIEKQWTDEEKIELGIKKQENTATIGEFCDMIKDFSDMLVKITGDLRILEVS